MDECKEMNKMFKRLDSGITNTSGCHTENQKPRILKNKSSNIIIRKSKSSYGRRNSILRINQRKVSISNIKRSNKGLWSVDPRKIGIHKFCIKQIEIIDDIILNFLKEIYIFV